MELNIMGHGEGGGAGGVGGHMGGGTHGGPTGGVGEGGAMGGGTHGGPTSGAPNGGFGGGFGGHGGDSHRGSTEGQIGTVPTPLDIARSIMSQHAFSSPAVVGGRNNTEGGTEGGNPNPPKPPKPPKHPHVPPHVPPIIPPHIYPHGCDREPQRRDGVITPPPLIPPFSPPFTPPPTPEVSPPRRHEAPPPASPEVPTGVFTGLHTKHQTSMQEKYRHDYTVPKAGPHQENLSAPSIGLNRVPIEKVGTGAEEHHFAAKHSGDMVPPRDPFHLGEWKHEIPGKTVIAGHVAFGSNPGPLYNLSHLGIHHGRPDQVTLDSGNGQKTVYTYSNSEIVKDPKDQHAWNRIFAPGDPAHPKLVLVTCTGPLISAHDVHREPALKGSQGLHKWRLVSYLDGQPPKPEK
jgi:hypothetical protein